MPTATLSNKSQIVVPADVRAHLELKPGDQISIEIDGDHAVLRKLPRSIVDELLEVVDPALFRGFGNELQRDRDDWDKPK